MSCSGKNNIQKKFRNKFVGSLVITFRFSTGDTDRKVSGKGVARKYSGIFFSEMNRISQKMIDVEPGMEFFGGSKSFGMSGLPKSSFLIQLFLQIYIYCRSFSFSYNTSYSCRHNDNKSFTNTYSSTAQASEFTPGRARGTTTVLTSTTTPAI